MIDLEKFSHFCIKPSDYGVFEQSRVVIYDKVKSEFCLLRELETGEQLNGSFNELAKHYDLTFKIQIKQNNRWVDHIPYDYLIKEQISEEQLKYKFFPCDGAKKLIIVFQAVNRKPGYNYIGTLSNVQAHRLYIKDDYGTDIATKSSYYLGPNKSTVIADKVTKLISAFCKSLNLDMKQCVTIGSSKGGFAAIYFGLKLNVGAVIAGGPQIFLGNFLNSPKEDSVNPPILTYLAGDNKEDSVLWANNVLPNLLSERKNDFSGTIYIHVGSTEPHYMKHVKPFVQMLKENNIENFCLDLGNYSSHSELAEHFPRYLNKHIDDILSSVSIKKENDIKNPHPYNKQENSGKILICTRFGIGVRDSSWFEHRFLLMESISIPSFMGQKNKNFIWCLFVDNEMEVSAHKKLISLLERSGINYLVCTQTYSKKSVNELIRSLNIADEFGYALTCRMDDDDALHPETFNKLFSEVESWRKSEVTENKDGVALTFPLGLEWVMYDQIDIWKRDAGNDHLEEAAVREFHRPFMGTSCFMYSSVGSKLNFLDISHADAGLEETNMSIDEVMIKTDEYMWLYARHKQSDSGITKSKNIKINRSLSELCDEFSLDLQLVENYINQHTKYGYLIEKKSMSKRMKLQNQLNRERLNEDLSTKSRIEDLERQLLELSSRMTANGLKFIHKSPNEEGVFEFYPSEEFMLDGVVRLVIYNYDIQEYSLLQEIDSHSCFSLPKEFFKNKKYKYKYQIKSNDGKWQDAVKYQKLTLNVIY